MSIDEFTALHGLVLKKAGQAEEVAEVLGASVDEVTPALDAAVAEKRAMAGRGKYMVTPAGRAFLDEQYPVLFAELRADPGADAAYAAFEKVNRELLALMTRWQTVTVGGEAVPNDHTDADYAWRRCTASACRCRPRSCSPPPSASAARTGCPTTCGPTCWPR